MKTLRVLVAAAWLAQLALATSAVRAGDGHAAGCGVGHGHGCKAIVCPNCYCELKCEQEAEMKSCFEVECKAICIPRMCMPWEKCCKPKCAKVKYVRTLKKVEYECHKCKYKFEPVCVDGCGAKGDKDDKGPKYFEGSSEGPLEAPVIDEPPADPGPPVPPPVSAAVPRRGANWLRLSDGGLLGKLIPASSKR